MRKLLAVVLLSLSMLGLSATPAKAALSCTVGSLCFYDNSSGSGASLKWVHDGEFRPGCNRLPAGAQLNTSYIYNRTGYAYRVYLWSPNKCGSVQSALINPNSQGAMTAPWNNSILDYYAY